MKQLIPFCLVFIFASLACGGQQSEITDAATVEMGDEFIFEDEGYALRVPVEFKNLGMVPLWGINILAVPESEITDPLFFVVGSVNSPEYSLEELMNAASRLAIDVARMGDIIDGGETTFSNLTEMYVKGYPALTQDFISTRFGAGKMSGRVTVVIISDSQNFAIIGRAPSEIWDEQFSAAFDATLETVRFFESASQVE